MKEYRLAKGWAIFIYITAPLLIIVFGALLVMPFFPGMGVSLAVLWFLGPVSLGMIALMVYGLADAVKGKFVIDTDKVYTKGVFSDCVLKLDEIKGFRSDEKYIFIESNVKGKKTIKISVYYKRTDEIIAWLASRYPDLHILNAEQEEREILSNEEFGFTTEQREEQLKRARRAAAILNWAGGVTGAWALFWPRPYEYMLIASILILLIAIGILKLYNGLIRIDEKTGSVYPSVFWAIIASSMGLCLRALFDFDIFDYSNVWKPTVIICLFVVGAMIVGNKEFKFRQLKDYMVVLTISLLAFGYSYGSVVILNCYYDSSVPEMYSAKILSKRMSSGKTTSYYFKLTPWGPQKEIDEVSVSKDLYGELNEGNDVTVYLNQGRFGVPWYSVTQ